MPVAQAASRDMLKRAFKELSDESTYVVRIRSAIVDGGTG